MARPRHQFALALEIMAQFKNSHLEHFKVTLLLELGRVQFKNQVPISSKSQYNCQALVLVLKTQNPKSGLMLT